MPGKHALIIGNSHYEDPTLAKLKAPEADVAVLAELLNDSAIGQFDSVRAVIDESEATTRRAIAGFFAQGKPDDLLLLYFSGHGVLDDKGRLYLAAKDTQRDLPQATAIPAAFITDGMDSSRSRRQVLILDCCHSGAFARGARSATGAKAITESTFEGVGYGRAVLTATDATQYAWEGEAVIGAAENSVFTHYMIEGLRSGEADGDADGEITLEELYDYIYGQVVKQTPKQTPRKWSYNQEGTLVIARNPRPMAAKAAPLPPELQQTIDDSRPWVREGGVAELSRLLEGSRPGLARAALEALQQLTNDDSRRVADAAAKALAAHRPASEPSAAEQQAERERLSREAERKLAEQQQAREAELANRKAREEVARRAAELEAKKPQPAEDRRAIERAEGEGMLAAIPAPVAEPRLPASVAAWMDKPWFPLASLTVGWGAAMFIAQFTWWILTLNGQGSGGLAYSLILGFLGGTVTWFALRASMSTEREIPPMLIVGLWVVTILFGLWLYPLLRNNGIGIDESVAVERAILGAVGGIGTSVVLYRTGRMVNSQRTVIIGVGWALAWLVSAWLGLSLLNLFGGDVSSGIKESLTNLGLSDDTAVMLVPWVFSLIYGLEGALAGLIGGWVMLGQLRRDKDEASTPTGRPTTVQRPRKAAGNESAQTTLGEKSLVEVIPGLAVWAEKPWFLLAMMSVGWGAALFLAQVIAYNFAPADTHSPSWLGGWLMGSLIGGAITAFSLQASDRNARVTPAAFIIGIWLGVGLFGPWVYDTLRDAIGIDEGLAGSLVLFGAAGGMGTSMVLYRAKRITDTQRLLIICAGWAIAWAVAAWLGLQVINLFGDDPWHGIKEALKSLGLDSNFALALVPWVDAVIKGLIGALAGLISGWVMFRQLRSTTPHEP